VLRTNNEVYQRFAAIWANGEPVRTEAELSAALRAAGIAPEQATDEWLRAFQRAWVYGESEEPFTDERTNRSYRRELGG
jgi:hypothetical protein